MTYVRPPAFTAHRVIRAMTKTCATHEIGIDGFALVSLIAHQWDAVRYVRPVSYRISTLINLLNLGSKQSLYRIERRCLAAGWLKRENQGTRMPILYWADIPPHAAESGDGPTEDGGGPNSEPNTVPNSEPNTVPETFTNPGPIRTPICYPNGTQTGPPSSLYPIPVPVPGRDAGLTDGDPTTPARDADRWRYEQLEAWARPLIAARCKIGPQNWTAWKGLVDAHGGSERVAAVAATVAAKTRWPDHTEEALKALRGQEPIGAVVSRKIIDLSEES